MNLNKEKQTIIEAKGNVLVTANPGTGKTLLIAHKFLSLVKEGVKIENILCLTFTDKARREMEKRIIELLTKENIQFDYSKLNIFTFHAYSAEHIEDNEIITSNLLRFAIYEYLRENETLNYGEEYLLNTIVPKMENLIRYLKSFGITPEQINIKEAQQYLTETEKYSKEEIDKYAEEFVKIFKHYEEIKKGKGVDYTDLLLEFLKLRNPPKFDFVLVDELQDVNQIETQIALLSGKQFFAVGDKKQAIFGFQGGSILNFKRFEKASKFILSENFRSSNEILNYSKNYFIERTKDNAHKEELENLKSSISGNKPVVYEIDKASTINAICKLVKENASEDKTVAVIVRTNFQIMNVAKEMKALGLNFSSTFFSASDDAKESIITFLKGILSKDANDVKNSMFTPFFPLQLQDAFDIVKNKYIKFQDILDKCPDFREMREKVKTAEDINWLFTEKIIPVAISYGKEHLYAALNVQKAYHEALKTIGNVNLSNLVDYMESSDLLSDESDIEDKIVLTTVHKAKGKEFDTVIYVPAKTLNKTNFQDDVVKAILKTKGIDAEEELEEETLRIDFVAFTRAKEKLIILTEKPAQYMNAFIEQVEIETLESESHETHENLKRAYSLFLNGDFDLAKKELENKEKWIVDYVKKYFASLEHISYSSLKKTTYDYFVEQILGISPFSSAMSKGSDIHDIAEKILKNENVEYEEEIKPFVENLKKLIDTVKNKYPELHGAEEKFSIPLKEVVSTDEIINFNGKIDAVFKNGSEYLIVDWKSDKKNDRASEHRQQLEAYRRAFSFIHKVPIDNIKVAIGFIGLRGLINTGVIEAELDEKQPVKSSFETFSGKVNKILTWKKDVNVLFEDLISEKVDDSLWRSVVEEFGKEAKGL